MNQTTAQHRCFVGSGRPSAESARTPVLRYSEEPDRTREKSGSSEYLRTGVWGVLPSRRAYTLIEVMVVAVIVVLMLGMALPVFRAITGGRSEAGATNIIAGMLGRARTDAIGLQKTMGVAIVYNQTTQVTNLAEVEFPDCPTWTNGLVVAPGGYFTSTYSTTNGSVSYYFVSPNGTGPAGLPQPGPTNQPPAAPGGAFAVGGPPLEIRPNTELVPLPTGIGVQSICNSLTNSNSQRTTDGYLSFGVILFDGNGRMTSQYYGVSAASKLAVAANLGGPGYPDPTQTPNIGYYNQNNVLTQLGVPSQYGLVVYQREAFIGQNFPLADPAYTTSNSSQAGAYSSGSPSQQAEETWLDLNSTPLLIDRYTGTLIRGE